MTDDNKPEASTPARVKWTRGALLAAKREEQAKVDDLGHLDRDLTPEEHARLLLALRRLREISKQQAQRRAVLPKGSRHCAQLDIPFTTDHKLQVCRMLAAIECVGEAMDAGQLCDAMQGVAIDKKAGAVIATLNEVARHRAAVAKGVHHA